MNTKIARTFIALSAASLALLPAVAGAQSAAPTPPAMTAPQSAPQQPITVSYYAGNPAQGGKLLSKVTLTRPQRGPEMRARGPQGQPQQGSDQKQRGERQQGNRSQQRPHDQANAQQPQGKPPVQGQQGQGKGHGHHGHHGRGGHNPLMAQAPQGATFAIIKDEHGSHVIDLTKPMMRPQGQPQQGQPAPAPAQK